jgi:hypothetical protein
VVGARREKHLARPAGREADAPGRPVHAVASCQAAPSALTLTAKSSLPARPISALPS